jgi:hypothetical protein
MFPKKFIANPDEKGDAGKDIRVRAFSNGTFETWNSRNNNHMTYPLMEAGK